ncbi:E3 ubiquitin-protein ligase Midline-1-like [Mercenaria mercenaria]|uniref:E3 ubiquitin-protein ligase Midline-1-like n=1 Tax=Mercenaria mercenaria TaxID=6596 RepID=UPI00234F0280|nr:E3 ubiquitin-protein ligase Midline-1-like [Mercenaria mercenaria]
MMAEGGSDDFTLIQFGSDVEYEYTCTPCADDGCRYAAIYYCRACTQWLCSTCTKYHKRISSSKNHHLFTIEEVQKQDSHMLPSVVKAKCPKHPEREVEMYCGNHDMVYCALCVAKDHRACCQVEEVADIINTHFSQSKYETIIHELAEMQVNLDALIMTKEENIELVNSRKMEISKEQQDLINQMVSTLRQLKVLSDNELDEKHMSMTKKFQLEIANCQVAVRDVEKHKNELMNSKHSPVTNRFVRMKLAEQVSTQSGKLLASIDTKAQNLSFERNKVLRDTVVKSTSLGQVREDLETSKDAYSQSYQEKRRWLTIEANVRVDADRGTCNITDICCLPDGTILLADVDNEKVKRLDNVYNVQDYIDFGSGPMGVCCIGENEVAVKLNKDEMQVLRVGKTMSVIRTMSIEGGGYYGIAFCTNNIWVCAGSYVNVYSGTGILLKRLECDKCDSEIFEGETQNIFVSDNDNSVYIADYSERVLKFNQYGELKGTLSDTSLVGTSAVCISEEGTV